MTDRGRVFWPRDVPDGFWTGGEIKSCVRSVSTTIWLMQLRKTQLRCMRCLHGHVSPAMQCRLRRYADWQHGDNAEGLIARISFQS